DRVEACNQRRGAVRADLRNQTVDVPVAEPQPVYGGRELRLDAQPARRRDRLDPCPPDTRARERRQLARETHHPPDLRREAPAEPDRVRERGALVRRVTADVGGSELIGAHAVGERMEKSKSEW